MHILNEIVHHKKKKKYKHFTYTVCISIYAQ